MIVPNILFRFLRGSQDYVFFRFQFPEMRIAALAASLHVSPTVAATEDNSARNPVATVSAPPSSRRARTRLVNSMPPRPRRVGPLRSGDAAAKAAARCPLRRKPYCQSFSRPGRGSRQQSAHCRAATSNFPCSARVFRVVGRDASIRNFRTLPSVVRAHGHGAFKEVLLIASPLSFSTSTRGDQPSQ